MNGGESTLISEILAGEEGTRVFACKLAASLTGGMQIGLSGGLGAGKTTLIRLLVAELGGLTPVSSPTYILQHEYPTSRGLTVEHWDLYRLNGLPEELQGKCSPAHLRLIEWPERAPELISCLDLHLSISFCEDPAAADSRLVTIEKGLISGV